MNRIMTHYYFDFETKIETARDMSMYEGLKYGLAESERLGHHIRHVTRYNDSTQYIGVFHPDHTYTDSFRKRYRWTGDRGDHWDRSEKLVPFDIFSKTFKY